MKATGFSEIFGIVYQIRYDMIWYI